MDSLLTTHILSHHSKTRLSEYSGISIRSRKIQPEIDQLGEIGSANSSDGIPARLCIESFRTASRVGPVGNVIEGCHEGRRVNLLA